MNSPVLLLNRIALAFVLIVAGASASDRWTAFQGPKANKFKATDLPLKWSPTENITWKVKLVGYGQSSPVAWDGQIFVTSVSGAMKEKCHVCAYDSKTGKEIWQHELASATQVESSNYVSKAAPSPVVDKDGITALFEGGNLISFTHDGKVRWQRDLVKDYGALDSRHGLASSLEQGESHAFVWIERQENPYLLAVSKATGETVWKSKGLGVTSWSSPRLVPVDNGHQLVLSGIGKLAGIDPSNGKHLWDFDEISNNSTPTPIPVGNGRFLIGATEGRGESSGGNPAESNGLIQITKQEDGNYKAGYVWHAKKATTSFGSPLAHQGLAYFVNRAGVVFCLDLENGEEKYAQRSAGSIWATPIAVQDRIYLFGRNGTTTVIKTGPQFERLSENELWKPDGGQRPAAFGGSVLYAAIVVNKQLIVRRGDILYSIAN